MHNSTEPPPVDTFLLGFQLITSCWTKNTTTQPFALALFQASALAVQSRCLAGAGRRPARWASSRTHASVLLRCSPASTAGLPGKEEPRRFWKAICSDPVGEKYVIFVSCLFPSKAQLVGADPFMTVRGVVGLSPY